MKDLKIILMLFVATILCSCDNKTPDHRDTINPLIGDISFQLAFGEEPDASTDENLRIRTHLAYTEDLLRRKDVSHLTEALRLKREQLLDLLHQYTEEGNFPKNYDFPGERVPCFIDRQGRICAVGYLVEQTAGRTAAETINEKYQYEKIFSMKDEALDRWIASSGLTKEECAMIQPSYNSNALSYIREDHISKGYAVTSSIFAGTNLSLSTLNAIQISKGAKSPAVGVFSLWTGAGAVFTGIYKMPKDDISDYHRGDRTLSMVNIGLGTATMIMGICNLSSNRPKRNESVSWNIYSLPGGGKKPGIGFSLTKRL